ARGPRHDLSSFQCTADPRDLHSFPTRRSSDLAAGSADPARRPVLPSCPVLSSPAGAPPAPPLAGGSALAGSSCWVVGSCVRDRRSEEHTSELQSRENLVCRLLLEKKKKEQAYS